MRNLYFHVEKQTISKNPGCDFSNIVAGTSGYLQAVFSFSTDWYRTLKVAEFRRFQSDDPIPVPIINNRCMIPSDILQGREWSLNVVGKNGDVRITTNKIKVSQEV